jgi:hypothetical protein
MSNQAGTSNLLSRLTEAGITVEKGNPALPRILERIKERESQGYSSRRRHSSCWRWTNWRAARFL